MSVAVRYFSRSGNTKTIADAIAQGASTTALSVDNPHASINERVDILFIGGGLYAYGIDKKLKAFIKTLSPDKIGKAVCFSTAWISKHAIDILVKELSSKGIPVDNDTFYCKGSKAKESTSLAKAFGATKAL